MLAFSHSYRNYSIKPEMLTITVNTFKNIDKKFHNDPRKTLWGYVHLFQGGDLLLLTCVYTILGENERKG